MEIPAIVFVVILYVLVLGILGGICWYVWMRKEGMVDSISLAARGMIGKVKEKSKGIATHISQRKERKLEQEKRVEESRRLLEDAIADARAVRATSVIEAKRVMREVPMPKGNYATGSFDVSANPTAFSGSLNLGISSAEYPMDMYPKETIKKYGAIDAAELDRLMAEAERIERQEMERFKRMRGWNIGISS